MTSCDVLIIGGGPGGSSCARALTSAGVDVVVMDKAVFPRDKVCAGWITPQAVTDLQLDLDEYARGRTLQPIHGFRSGVIGRKRDVVTNYRQNVSYGIRRCEFDHYLLQRSQAKLCLGEAVSSIRRVGQDWIVNDRVRARMLVGAGGHFCPVTRCLNDDRLRSVGELRRGSPDLHDPTLARLSASVPAKNNWPVVAAVEAEFPIDGNASAFAVEGEMPELYFSADLDGYGWCFRKQHYLNIGLGSLNRQGCAAAAEGFVAYLRSRGRIPRQASWKWRGHAYLLAEPRARTVCDDAVLLIGDAAGLAYPQSGEGIRPAIESGMMAAAAILGAHGNYSRDRLAPYEQRLGERFGTSITPHSSPLPASVMSALAVGLMRIPAFVRRVVLDRWFLRVNDAPLTV